MMEAGRHTIARMKHVLWIGGPPVSGKTTVATRLARHHGLRLNSADTRTWAHRDRALAAGNAAAMRWESMTHRERWELSTTDEMLEMSLHRERGSMVIDDLSALPPSPLIVAEGSTLPASALTRGIAARSRAVWLIPSAASQRTQLAARAATGGNAQLYLLLGKTIEEEARNHGAPIVTVDGSRGIAETVNAVEHLFGGTLAAGPRARTPGAGPQLLQSTLGNRQS